LSISAPSGIEATAFDYEYEPVSDGADSKADDDLAVNPNDCIQALARPQPPP
jgi:hypothetical protein